MRTKKNYRIPVLVLTLLSLVFSCSVENEAPPNIIVFIADDVSWNDFGCYGNSDVNTPNIDALASEGLKFNNAFLTASSCSPSRISILTGRYPHNTGACELHTDPELDLPGIADVLKENGYYCAQAGKWHAGELLKSGFDTLMLKIEMNGGEENWLKLLQNRPSDKPFFLWLASIDAHRDWGENQFSGTHHPDKITPPPYLVNDSATKSDLAAYYDEIYRFDHYIGMLTTELEKQNILDNTLIIVMADNGRPFPGCKTRVYKRGMQTPFVVYWKKTEKNKGKSSQALISSIDIAPTLLDVAGISDIPVEFQGKSFREILFYPELPFRKYAFAEHNWHDYEAHERMVRTPEHMYVLNSRPAFSNQGPADAVSSPAFASLLAGKEIAILTEKQQEVFLSPRPAEELYDCIREEILFTNRIDDTGYNSIAAELRNVLQTWMEETGDNVPDSLTKDWYHRELGIALTESPYFQVRGEMPGKSNHAAKNNNPGPF